MKRSIVLLSALTIITLSFNSCKKDDRPAEPLLFSADDDVELGQQVKTEIESDPGTYPIWDENTNQNSKDCYAFLNGIKNDILNSGKVKYKDKFAWELKIIEDDSVLNAFCTPGGYIYVYTGLLKYLDAKDQLAGVLGHEMAHADLRHTSRTLQQQYGISLLLSIILGENTAKLGEIAAGMYLLKNSRDHESEADQFSVKFLCPTVYEADGAADFFTKLINSGNDCQSAFFSTHPCPSNRVQSIHNHKTDEGCTGTGTFDAEYATFKSKLP